jgi:hypothetical protein
MFIFVVQTLQNKWNENLHETTSWWKTYGKQLFSEDLEVREDFSLFWKIGTQQLLEWPPSTTVTIQMLI